MNVTVGTFNLNNLFSRYNFKGEIDAIKNTETSVASEITYEFGPQDAYRIRTFKGRLVNDPPDSPDLQPFVADTELNLVDALANPVETRPPKADTPPPSSAAWTHRFKPSGQPAQYELYDHIWLSSPLANKQTGAWIDRRQRHGGDGSDHDPAWVELSV